MNEKQLKEAMKIIGKRGGEKTAELHKDKLSEWGKKGAATRERNKKLRAGDNSLDKPPIA